MISDAVSRLHVALQPQIELQHYAAVKLALVAVGQLVEPPTSKVELTLERFRRISNPFLIRNAIEFLRKREELVQEETYRDYFCETFEDASLMAGLTPEISILGGQARRESHFQPMSHPFQVFENTRDAYLRGHDRNQFCDRTATEAMCLELELALDWIATQDELYSQLKCDVHSFVPISSATNDVHRSHTSTQLPGVIFISHCRDTNRLAEAVVHELGHVQLDAILRFDEVVIDRGQQFYSPWRDDPRPVHALLHAVHVFCKVARFFLRMLESQDRYHEWMVKRLRRLTGQLRIGFRQLRSCEFTECGQEILEDLRASLVLLTQRGYTPVENQTLSSHYDRWCKRNQKDIGHLVDLLAPPEKT